MKSIFSLQKDDARPSQVESGSCLLVLLRPRLALADNLCWPLKSFSAQERLYQSTEFGDWTGFHDWLRGAEGNILGVRYTPCRDVEFLADVCSGLPYVKIEPEYHIEIFFSRNREYAPNRSRDQAFQYNAIFRSSNGEFAIAFGKEELKQANLRGTEGSYAEWTVAQASPEKE